jgi:HEAT repeat protein
MSASGLQKAALGAATLGMVAGSAGAAQENAVHGLIKKIKDDNPDVRTEGWLGAGEAGAPAVPALAKVMTDPDREVARAAKRAMWKIVRHAGRPGAETEKRDVVLRLLELLGDDVSTPVRTEVLWMLSELGEDTVIEPIAALLKNPELREDARMALERIPGSKSALSAAFEGAPEEFKPNLAQSLRKLGVEVKGYPCAKLTPVKQTKVKSLWQRFFSG